MSRLAIVLHRHPFPAGLEQGATARALLQGPAWREGGAERLGWPVDQLDVPEDLPFVPEGSEPALRLVTRGAEKADEHEIAENPRAASVRLRAVERVHAGATRTDNHRGVA